MTTSISVSGSIDEYTISLQAGYAYQFDAFGQGSGAGTLTGTALKLTAASGGAAVAGASATTPSSGDSRIAYTPSAAGTYYLDVSGTGVGTYNLVSAPQDDDSNLPGASATLVAGASLTGSLDTVADYDLYAVSLTAGVTYQFDAQGLGTGAGTAASPLLALYLLAGPILIAVTQPTTPATGDSRITYAPTVSGTYYLDVSGGGTGTYTLASTFSRSTTTVGQSGTAAAGGTVTTTLGGINQVNVPNGGTVNSLAGTINQIILGAGQNVVNSAGEDNIMAGAGPSTITVSGTDTIYGGTGALTVTNGANPITVVSGAGGLTYTGGTGADLIVGRGGPINVQGGTGGGVYFGAGNSKIVAGAAGLAVMVGSAGDQLFSAGSAGDLFGALAGGDIVMSGLSSSGNDVFFGAAGTGTLTFITGSGNDILGLGQGTNKVTLGAGRSTVFANIGTTGVSTITAGSGSADIGLGGKSVNLVIQAGTAARNFTLFNFVPGADKISLSGFDSAAAANAIATQTVASGITTLSFADKTTIQFINLTHADSSFFG